MTEVKTNTHSSTNPSLISSLSDTSNKTQFGNAASPLGWAREISDALISFVGKNSFPL